jgi:hypothetical protein
VVGRTASVSRPFPRRRIARKPTTALVHGLCRRRRGRHARVPLAAWPEPIELRPASRTAAPSGRCHARRAGPGCSCGRPRASCSFS